MNNRKPFSQWTCFCVAALLVSLFLVGCGGSLNRFPERAPVWQDTDVRAFAERPEEYFSPFAWDGANNIVFLPISRFLAVDPAGRAANVNGMDEVPNSSWWTNRIGYRDMSMREFINAACEDEPPLDPNTTWTIFSAKPNGANPGFIIKDENDRKYLLKFDGDLQPERATAADVSGSIYYHAAGYFTPCNRVIHFDPSILVIEEGTTYEDSAGVERPLEMALIEESLTKATLHPDGRIRGSSSLFIDGRPIGPWTYDGTLSEDPNDVVNHEDRRELRGGMVLASWFNHFDAREQNTMAAWMTTDEDSGAGYVRHYYIDFGDCYGSEWPHDDLSRRLGHSGYFDPTHLFEDFATFGLVARPWRHNRFGPAGRPFGYFDVDTFDPENYRTGYPNPAFIRSQEHDSAWMARIIAHFSDDHIRAVAQEAQFSRPLLQREIVRILSGRRDKILRRWFHTLSPLSHPTLEDTATGKDLCLRDLAVHSEQADRAGTQYMTRAFVADGHNLEPLEAPPLRFGATPESVCVRLPAVEGASADEPAYLVVDVLAQRGELDDHSAPVRLHFYQQGSSNYLLAGLERLDDRDDY